jgi:hypothetical protein
MRHILAAFTLVTLAAASHAQTLGTGFAANYSAVNLGSVTGLPTNYGGLTFLNNNTLLIGGAANGSTGSLYTVGVTRDVNGFVTGFSGAAQRYGTQIGAYNDGGVVFGPGGVLFTARWNINELGQTKPGSSTEDKIINLAPLGVATSVSAINFVPAGFAGAGQFKLVSYGGGQWYSAGLTPDGNGTYDVTGLAQVDLDLGTAGVQTLPGGPEGFVYIAGTNPGFGANSLLVSEYAAGTVSTYLLDANGNPLLSTRRVFLSGLNGAEGAAIDPVTGDFFFSTFGSGNQVFRVTGFAAPVPEPATMLLMVLGLAVGAAQVRRRSSITTA